MGFVKRARIKKRQAKSWMHVCHAAMELFPDEIVATTDPKRVPDIVVALLKELSQRRGGSIVLPAEWGQIR